MVPGTQAASAQRLRYRSVGGVRRQNDDAGIEGCRQGGDARSGVAERRRLPGRRTRAPRSVRRSRAARHRAQGQVVAEGDCLSRLIRRPFDPVPLRAFQPGVVSLAERASTCRKSRRNSQTSSFRSSSPGTCSPTSRIPKPFPTDRFISLERLWPRKHEITKISQSLSWGENNTAHRRTRGQEVRARTGRRVRATSPLRGDGGQPASPAAGCTRRTLAAS